MLLEHKSKPEVWVALQLLRYMVRIWERLQHRKVKKLPPIIPIVVYHGETTYIFDRGLPDELPRILALLRGLADEKTALEYLEVALRYLSAAAEEIEPAAVRAALAAAFDDGGGTMAGFVEKWIEEGRQEGRQEGDGIRVANFTIKSFTR